ncbi:MAG: hypothetical protein GX640_23400 [Fibrobacter sp.]|nr:hypothetical protein [Fibrobacter sp.]
MKHSIFSIIFILTIIGCNPVMVMKSPPPTNEIALCIESDTTLPAELRDELDSVTNLFIDNYNAENNRFTLTRCQNDDQRTLYLDIIHISISNPELQAAGIVITTLGLAIPVVMIALNAPFYVTFAYLPRSTLSMNLRFSSDLSDSGLVPKTYKTGATSGRYFGSYKKQKDHLLSSYYQRLEQVINSIKIGSPSK